MASSRPATTFTSLAEDYHLGAVLRVFLPDTRLALIWGLLGGISILATGVIAVLTATTLSADADVGNALPLPLPLLCGLPLWLLVCLCVGAWILVGPRAEAQQMRVVVCEHGILWYGRRVQVIRWEDMRMLWCNADLEHATRVRLTGPNKRFVVIPAYLDEWQTLVRWIERDLTARFFPRALAQYERTQRVCFGPLTLTPRGIDLAHRPTLSWHEVVVSEQKTMLVLMRVEPVTTIQSVWVSIPLTQIPNKCVLEAMVKHCVRLSTYSPVLASTAATNGVRTTKRLMKP